MASAKITAAKTQLNFLVKSEAMALLDRSVIVVNEKAYAAFVAMLSAPPNPNARLLKTLQTPAVWE